MKNQPFFIPALLKFTGFLLIVTSMFIPFYFKSEFRTSTITNISIFLAVLVQGGLIFAVGEIYEMLFKVYEKQFPEIFEKVEPNIPQKDEPIITCKKCSNRIELSEHEKIVKQVICPQCGKVNKL
jgi:Zn finger protein HypA/HybF involved in hydrogenase expression